MMDSELSFRERTMPKLYKLETALRLGSLTYNEHLENLKKWDEEVLYEIVRGIEPEMAIRTVISRKGYLHPGYGKEFPDGEEPLFLPTDSIETNTVYCASETLLFLFLAEKFCGNIADYNIGLFPEHALVVKYLQDGTQENIDYGYTTPDEHYIKTWGRKPVPRPKNLLIDIICKRYAGNILDNAEIFFWNNEPKAALYLLDLCTEIAPKINLEKLRELALHMAKTKSNGDFIYPCGPKYWKMPSGILK